MMKKKWFVLLINLALQKLTAGWFMFSLTTCHVVWTLLGSRAALSTRIWGPPAEKWWKVQEWSWYRLKSIEKEKKIRNHQTMTKQSSLRAGGESWLWVFWLPLQPERTDSNSTHMRIPPSQATRGQMGSLVWWMVHASSLNIEWKYIVRIKRNELTSVDKNYICSEQQMIPYTYH